MERKLLQMVIHNLDKKFTVSAMVEFLITLLDKKKPKTLEITKPGPTYFYKQCCWRNNTGCDVARDALVHAAVLAAQVDDRQVALVLERSVDGRELAAAAHLAPLERRPRAALRRAVHGDALVRLRLVVLLRSHHEMRRIWMINSEKLAI